MRRLAIVTLAACGVLTLLVRCDPATAQSVPRLNRLIAQVAADRPAISGVDWQFIDMEHGAYLLDRLEERLGAIEREDGRPRLAPMVRIPMEGDEPLRFAVK